MSDNHGLTLLMLALAAPRRSWRNIRAPFRPPMLPTEALAELERHRRTQFDPEIVEAMIQVVLGRFAEPALLGS